MNVMFRSQDLWDLVNNDYNEVINLKEFKMPSIE